MRMWNEQNKRVTSPGAIGGVPCISRISSPDGDPERESVDAERRDGRAWTASEGFVEPVPGDPSQSQFVNETCRYCKHAFAQHFYTTDEIGFWSFCMLERCDCFLDQPKEDDAT